MECNTYINNGMFLRATLTVFTLYLLKDKKHLFIILPIVLIILDGVDNAWTFFYKKNTCADTLNYRVKDKIVDIVTYIAAYCILDLRNPLLLFFIGARAIGVVMYTLTYNPVFLVVFTDFVKEHMLYTYVFGNNTTYLLPCVLLKMVYEYMHHITKVI
jgi:hypothetical protein